MAREIKAGSWVQIHQVVLTPEERAPQVPDDTKKVPLELRVKGFLINEAKVGAEVEIETIIGRRLKGFLEDSDPAYEHKFGRPIPEILKIGRDLRIILNE